jgi:hypothetical protein
MDGTFQAHEYFFNLANFEAKFQQKLATRKGNAKLTRRQPEAKGQIEGQRREHWKGGMVAMKWPNKLRKSANVDIVNKVLKLGYAPIC